MNMQTKILLSTLCLLIILGAIYIFNSSMHKKSTENKNTEETVVTLTEANDQQAAEEALTTYMRLLYAEQYDSAAEKGIDPDLLELLQDWNPIIPANDIPRLLRNGCGLLVCRPIRSIIEKKQTAEHTFLFTVEFADNAGAIYVMNGPDGQPPRTKAEITVKKVGTQFLVSGIPVSP